MPAHHCVRSLTLEMIPSVSILTRFALLYSLTLPYCLFAFSSVNAASICSFSGIDLSIKYPTHESDNPNVNIYNLEAIVVLLNRQGIYNLVTRYKCCNSMVFSSLVILAQENTKDSGMR